ncbi:MAG: phage head closure protein [Carboxydocellales bacterium]
MRAGELNRRITIQQPVETPDSEGVTTTTWGTFTTAWAAVEPLSGREFFNAQQFNSELTTRFRIRYQSGITTKMRVLFEARVFDILSVIPLKSAKKEIHLMTKEVI